MVIQMTYEGLRKKLLDYYGTATGFFPAAWGDVLEVERADNEKLICMAIDAGIDISGLLSVGDMREALEQYYEAAGFSDYYNRVLKDTSDDGIRDLFRGTFGK